MNLYFPFQAYTEREGGDDEEEFLSSPGFGRIMGEERFYEKIFLYHVMKRHVFVSS